MAIPVINQSPKYKVTIPSLKKQVFFRPFLVKEQKILLMAMETQDQETILKSMVDTVTACLEEPIDQNIFTTFDVEYLFTKIRAKSVGETADILILCQECNESNEVKINLDEIQIKEVEKAPDITLNDQYTLRLKYPKYNAITHDILKNQDEMTFTSLLFKTAIQTLDKILTSEEIIDLNDEPEEEKIKFLDNLNSDQFKSIMDFVQSIPKLTHDIKFTCTSCNHENHQQLQGMQDFF